MKAPILLLGLMVAFGAGCTGKHGGEQALESVYTDLHGGSCVKETDKTDPNETPYLRCPGAAGYSLLVRQVESGRESVEVVDAANRVHALNYQEFITRSMSNLEGKAEWRVETKDQKQSPAALIVRVQAREDIDNPEKVTHTYLAVAKITANEICVTDRIDEAGRQQNEIRRVADSAQARPCATPQPPAEGGEGTVR